MKISVFLAEISEKFRVLAGSETKEEGKMSTTEISKNFAKNRRNFSEISVKREISAIFLKNCLQLENFWEISFCFGLFRLFFSDFVKKNLYLYSSKHQCWIEALMAEDGGVRAWRWVDFMAERESWGDGSGEQGDGSGEQRRWVRQAVAMGLASNGDGSGKQQRCVRWAAVMMMEAWSRFGKVETKVAARVMLWEVSCTCCSSNGSQFLRIDLMVQIWSELQRSILCTSNGLNWRWMWSNGQNWTPTAMWWSNG